MLPYKQMSIRHDRRMLIVALWDQFILKNTPTNAGEYFIIP